MKKIFVAMLALAAAAACSNEEIVSVNREAIAFDNAFINNSVRSVSDPSFTNTAEGIFEDFAVYGFVSADNQAPAAIFDGTKVYLDGAWTYDATQYWIEDATYNFYAVAPMTDGGWICSGDANANGLVLYVQNYNGTKDVLFAKASTVGESSGNNVPVEFNFQHILSKVKFSFTNNYDATGSSIRVKNIKITNARGGSLVTLTKDYIQWGPGGDSGVPAPNLDFGMATDNEATTDVKENVEVAYAYGQTYESQKELLLIPVAVNGGYNVTFDVEVLVGTTVVKTYGHSVNVNNFTPEAGHSYDIKAVINATNINPDGEELDPIEFTVTGIDGWDDTDANKTI